MGCWNETCGFTQETIRAGEPVYAVIIINNTSIQKSCYGDGISKPMSFIIEGTYDDYGSIESINEDSFVSKLTLKHFNNMLKDGTLQMNSYHSDVDKQYFDNENGWKTVKELFNTLERGHLTLKRQSWQGSMESSSLYFMLMGRDTIDSAFTALENSNAYEREDDQYELIRTNVAKTINDNFMTDNTARIAEINKQLEELAQLVEDEKADEDEPIEDMIERELEKLDKPKSDNEKMISILYRELWKLEDRGSDDWCSYDDYKSPLRYLTSYEAVDKNSFTDIYKTLKDIIDDVDKDEMIEDITKFIMLLKTFQAFRKSWAPQGHSTQWDSFDLQITFYEQQLRKMYQKRKDRIDNGWYEDDDIPQVLGALSVFEEGELICNNS